MSNKQHDALFNRGLQFQREGDLQHASDYYSQLLSLKPDHFMAMNNIALIAQELGRQDLALAMLTTAQGLAPTNLEILRNLASLQSKAGDPQAAEKTLRKALSLAGEAPELRLDLGQALYDQDKIEAARSIFESLLSKASQQLHILFKLGVVCMRQGDTQGAVDYLNKALVIEPDNSAVLNQLADQFLLLRKTAPAQQLLEKSLLSKVGNTRALSLQAVLFNLCGDLQALGKLHSPEHLLRTTRISVADEYPSTEAFNTKLLSFIEANAEMRNETLERATVKGLQSKSISALESPVMARMNELIRQGFDGMRERCRSMPELPFSQAMPRHYQIESWIVRLESGGFQRPHYHPAGWLSGCYYLQIPPEVGREDSANAGWLEFGRPEEIYQLSEPSIFHRYRPVVGEMVIFPSYYWHNTVPFTSGEERISIAFDIRPC